MRKISWPTSQGHEVFGSSSLVVRCPVIDTLVSLSDRLEGQLTATLHMEPVASRQIGIRSAV
jgi:2,5-dioxopentanoate dehydrogenase